MQARRAAGGDGCSGGGGGGVSPVLPGQLLQVEEAVAGYPQAGTCKSRTPFAPPSPAPLPTSPKTRLASAAPLSRWTPSLPRGNFVRLTGNFTVGRDSRAPARGYKDVRSRVFFPVHFDGRLRVGGELAVAPDDVDVSLFGGESLR